MILDSFLLRVFRVKPLVKAIEIALFILLAFSLNYIFANVVGIANFNPTLGLTIIAGILYGKTVGFSTGFTSMLLIQYQAGVYVLFQSIPMALCGLLAGLFLHKLYKDKQPNTVVKVMSLAFTLLSVIIFSILSNTVMFYFMPFSFESIITIIKGTLIFDLKHLIMSEITVGIFIGIRSLKKIK